MLAIQGGEPDLMTAAKMVLHDWQRGKIPFFVPPPKEENDSSEGPNDPEEDKEADDDQAIAARKAIADVILSQQLKEVPVQEDLFTENELKGEEDANDELKDGEDVEQLPATSA